MSVAWLFTRGAESIRVQGTDGKPCLILAGPGIVREKHEFDTVIDLAAFMIDTESRLLADGWGLERFDTERRRRSARAHPHRRRADLRRESV